MPLPPSDDIDLIEVTTPFQGHFRVDRYRFRYRLYSGDWSRPTTREVFERGHAVGVLLYDPALDRIVMIEQVRLPALVGGGPVRLLEIAAGIIDPGETEDAVAHREVKEETGLTITALEPICRFLASPGGTSESVALFAGRVDARGAGGVFGANHDEDIKVIPLAYTEAMEALAAGRIVAASAIIALQWLALNRERLRAKWG